MSETVKAGLILAVALIVAAFLNGGVYEIVATNLGGTDPSIYDYRGYRLNRFTGEVMAIVDYRAMIQVPVQERPLKK